MSLTINTRDARSLSTKKLAAVFSDFKAPKSFLRSFFKTVEADTLELSIEVVRGSQKIAVDVQRGTEGNRNTFSKSTEKVIIPPFYREYFDMTELDKYSSIYNTGGTVSNSAMNSFITNANTKLQELKNTIERAYEKQISDVFTTGILTLADGTTIDFKRKTASMVTLGSSARWTDAIDPTTSLKDGCDFIRNTGRSADNTFVAILGTQALDALVSNAKFIEKANLRRATMVDLNSPQANSTGGVFHGTIDAGPYVVELWTYPEVYEVTIGTPVPYVGEKNVIMLPKNPTLVMGYGAVPGLINTGNVDLPQTIRNVKGAYVIGNYIDHRNTTHVMDIKSAGVAIPVSVDQMYKLQPIA